MLLMSVDAFILEKPEEMELRIVLLPIRNEVLPFLVLEKIARSKTVVNALKLLYDDTTRSHIEMAYL
jgi:hypothetical protein